MAVVCLLCFFTQESRPSVLLTRHVNAVQKASNYEGLWTDNKDKVPDFHTFTNTMMVRPIHWFFTEPIVCAVTIMSGVIFSSVYLQTEGLTVTYEAFGFSERQSSLVFFAWIIGLTLTIPLRLNDWRIVSRRLQQKQAIRPEDKIVGFYVAAPVLAIALWWFSWTVPPTVSHRDPSVSLMTKKKGLTDSPLAGRQRIPVYLIGSTGASWSLHQRVRWYSPRLPD